MSDTVTIVGYSLDSVIEAVCRSSKGENVIYLQSGTLGEPLDRFNDMVSSRYSDMLSVFLPELEFTEVHNPRKLYIPYSSVKLDNNNNGVFQLPFSKNTFSDKDYTEILEFFKSPYIQECYLNKSATPSKLVSALKGNMPQNFVDTMIKALGVTRWRGIHLSHLTMFGYEYEYSFEHIAEEYSEVYCRPNISYHDICTKLLEKFGISTRVVGIDEIRKIIQNRRYPTPVVIMDNRIDYYMNYVCGRFDRVYMNIEKVKMPKQFMMQPDGIYRTPLSDFWAVIISGDDAYKCTATANISLKLNGVTEIPLTRNNVKMYDQYTKIIKLYGDKSIDLGQRMETLVK